MLRSTTSKEGVVMVLMGMVRVWKMVSSGQFSGMVMLMLDLDEVRR